MPATLYPGADTTAQWFAKRFPGDPIRPNCVVLHTTEGSGWPSYAAGSTAPHLTVKADTSARRLVWRQHLPLDRSARALRNAAGGVETNTLNAVQVELVGTSGWASPANPAAPYHAGPVWPGIGDWALDGLGEFLAWLNREWGVPLQAPYPFPDWRGGRRMTHAQWEAFRGICGHCHVPENDHTDPGALNIERVLVTARRIAGTPPVTPPLAPPAPAPAPGLKVSVAHLRHARYQDPPAPGRPLGPYAAEVLILERALVATRWLEARYADGHYGTQTVGDGSPGYGGVVGFQRKHSPTTEPDGWMGRRELALLFRLAGMTVTVEL